MKIPASIIRALASACLSSGRSALGLPALGLPALGLPALGLLALGLLALAPLATGCADDGDAEGGGGVTDPFGPGGPGFDTSGPGIDVPSGTPDVGGPDTGAPDTAGPTPTPDATGPGGGGDADGGEWACPEEAWGLPCDPVEGEFGWPCDGNSECISGFCIQSAAGKVCADFCLETCPEGWTCSQVTLTGEDTVFICRPRFPKLCDPCKQHSDCGESGVTGSALCVDYGSMGRFCGGDCSGGQPCPSGYECTDVPSPFGPTARQCVPTSGECTCSPAASQQLLSTFCTVSNAFGTCEGERYCVTDGLTDCNAKVPSLEVCDGTDNDCNGLIDDVTVSQECMITNQWGSCPGTTSCVNGQTECVGQAPEAEKCDGVDNDCNGLIDDGLCFDGNPCTEDVCDPETGCVYPPKVGPCDDGTVCTQNDACSNGECIGSPLNCDDGNPCTDDFCNAVSGCYHQNKTGTPCDDNNVCTQNDTCNNGACQSGPVMTCNDNNPCTQDSCVPNQGCVYNAAAMNGQLCDDKDPCTTQSVCSGGTCAAVTQYQCPFNPQCFLQTCLPIAGLPICVCL